MLRFARAVDALNDGLGRLCGWLSAAMVALMFALVVARYAFGAGSLAAQEAVLWLHAIVFLLGAGFALRHDRHVRVDVFAQRLSERARARIELLGAVLLLLPFCVFMLWISLDYVAASWSLRESSREPGGLPGVYLLKTLIPIAAATLALQGIAQALRAVLALRARPDAAA
ncbi:MAG TPA: TRAP transporter small permease subunit [Xanthomonadaceae bacterium]|nr:TRAP transporter small permease subunit [Xanthomonadaceae bacterium]